jgi:hypothetical protein
LIKYPKVIVYALGKGLDIAEHCATKTDFMQLEPLDRLMNDIMEGNFSEDATAARIEEINEKLILQEDKVDWGIWSSELLSEVDDAAKKHFIKCAGELGIDTEGYNDALKAYVDDVARLIAKYNASDLGSNAAAKFRWLMLRPSTPRPFPIPTAFVMDALIESWADLGDAMDEVSHSHCSPQCTAAVCCSRKSTIRHRRSTL